MLRRYAAGGLTAICLAASVAAVPTGAGAMGASPTVVKPRDPRVLASESAGALVASRAPQLKMSAGERFFAAAPISGARGLNYTAYTRTHRGLPVRGGDFVVTTDEAGRIAGTSVGQTKKIGALSLKASVRKAVARKAATRAFAKVTHVGKVTKAIHALGTPRLAWKVTVEGVLTNGDTITRRLRQRQDRQGHRERRQHPFR